MERNAFAQRNALEGRRKKSAPLPSTLIVRCNVTGILASRCGAGIHKQDCIMVQTQIAMSVSIDSHRPASAVRAEVEIAFVSRRSDPRTIGKNPPGGSEKRLTRSVGGDNQNDEPGSGSIAMGAAVQSNGILSVVLRNQHPVEPSCTRSTTDKIL